MPRAPGANRNAGPATTAPPEQKVNQHMIKSISSIPKLEANSTMVVYQNFVELGLGQCQSSKLSALSQAVENARETKGRLNATELHIDLKERDDDFGTGDVEWITILDNGEGTYNLLEHLNLGHADDLSSGNATGDAPAPAGAGRTSNYRIGKFGAGLKNVLTTLGDDAFIFSIPHEVDDLMCVARYGSKFQNGLVEMGLRSPEQPAKHYVAYFKLNGTCQEKAYRAIGDSFVSERVMTANSPFANNEQLVRPFELIKRLPPSGPGKKSGRGFLIAVTGLKDGLEVSDGGHDLIEKYADNSFGFQGMEIASVFFAQMMLPPSTKLFPMRNERFAAPAKSMAITLNGVVKVDTGEHLWEQAMRKCEACEEWDMKPSKVYTLKLKDQVTSYIAANVQLRHTWQGATKRDRALEHKESRSGIVVAIKDRCYVMRPDLIVNIDDILGKLHQVANSSNSHKTTYKMLVQLTNKDTDSELARPSLRQFLDLTKDEKFAVVGEGLLTVVRCDELYDYTDIAKEGFREDLIVNMIFNTIIEHRIQWAYDNLPGDINNDNNDAAASPTPSPADAVAPAAPARAKAARAAAQLAPASPMTPPRARGGGDGGHSTPVATLGGRLVKPVSMYRPDFANTAGGSGGSGVKRKAPARITPTEQVKRLKAVADKNVKVLKGAVAAWKAQLENMVTGKTEAARRRAAQVVARHVAKIEEQCLSND